MPQEIAISLLIRGLTEQGHWLFDPEGDRELLGLVMPNISSLSIFYVPILAVEVRFAVFTKCVFSDFAPKDL